MSLSAPPQTPPSPGFIDPDVRNYAIVPSTMNRAKEIVHDGLAAAREARGNIHDHWERQLNAYFSIRHRKNYYGRANVVDPEPYRAIETIYARMVRPILGQQPWVRGLPGPGEHMADARQAELNDHLIQYQIMKGSRSGAILRSDMKSNLTLGTSVLKAWWDTKTVKRKKVDPQTGKVFFERQKVWAGTNLRCVDIDNFFVAHPVQGESVMDQDYVIERRRVTKHELQQLEAAGTIPEGTVGRIPEKEFVSRIHDEEDVLRQARAEALEVEYEPTQAKNPPIKAIDLSIYEGKFDLYGKGEVLECWIWVVGKDHVILVSENPYRHGKRTYVSSQAVLVPGSFYGLSPISPILDLWAELNDLHNMGLDSAVLSLNPAIKIGAGAGVSMKKWVLAPGSFLPCNDSSQVEAFVLPPMTAVAHEAMTPIRSMMRETTSATDLLQAQSQGGIDKATIYTGAVQEANARIAMTITEYAQKMEDIWDLAWGMTQQYADKNMTVRILGREGFEWIPVRPEDIQYSMDWTSTAATNIGSALTRGLGIERFMTTMTPLALQGSIQLNLEELAKVWWEEIGLGDSSRIIAPKGPQPMDPEQENLMLTMRQMPDVNQHEDFAGHIKKHMPLMGHPDPLVVEMTQRHVSETQAMWQRVKQAEQAMGQLQAQQAMQQAFAPQGQNGNGQGAPALANQSAFGAEIGGVKEIGERLGGRAG